MGAIRLWGIGQEAFHWLGTSLGESLPSIQSPSTQPLGAGHLLLLPPPLHHSLHREPSSPTPTSLREPRRGFPDPHQVLLFAGALARTLHSNISRTKACGPGPLPSRDPGVRPRGFFPGVLVCGSTWHTPRAAAHALSKWRSCFFVPDFLMTLLDSSRYFYCNIQQKVQELVCIKPVCHLVN